MDEIAYHSLSHLLSLVSSEYFRAAIFRGSVECWKQSIFTHERGWAEVDEFHVKLVVNYDVFVLDVTMEDVNWMKILHRLAYL